MAPNMPGWAHPYDSPFVLYADGGDEPAAADPTVSVEPEPDGEPADDWAPPSREEYEATLAKLRTASGEAAARRKYLKQHGIDPKTGNRLDAEPTPEPEPTGPAADGQQPGMSQADAQKRVDRAVAEAKIEGMRGAKKLATNFLGALSEAGWNGTRLDLIMPLSDLDGADADDPEDLAERVDNVKKLFPEGFTPAKRTRNPAVPSNGSTGSGQNGAPAAKVDTADKPAPKPEPKNWAETLAARALHG
ncbi:hypothetical protein [Streptomyces sp. NPDC002088]|uniref:hypothetical protein n=1 Tax=Streptomyces sp. NPDC002088 TaxID=3154665 RepID=UPI00332DC2C1